jgi:hypothetical protein
MDSLEVKPYYRVIGVRVMIHTPVIILSEMSPFEKHVSITDWLLSFVE